ncbi:hypothetical protein RRG08_056691 [Elysia crispata]|uniref:Secreted protein n=1 Tax=Elysia crispata TaxID=231223 RepID=A0AAE0XT82_9GAST|nr:hypothetical protein RRG08_056691 [Elysia crispata]
MYVLVTMLLKLALDLPYLLLRLPFFRRDLPRTNHWSRTFSPNCSNCKPPRNHMMRKDKFSVAVAVLAMVRLYDRTIRNLRPNRSCCLFHSGKYSMTKSIIPTPGSSRVDTCRKRPVTDSSTFA